MNVQDNGTTPHDEHHPKVALGRGEDHLPHIRSYTAEDWPSVWAIIQPIIQAGETLAQPGDMTEGEAHHWWVDEHRAVFVAETDGTIQGTYYLTDNQPGRGSHIANGGYLVAPSAAGQGIGHAMGEHSLETAKALGYLAIQFNLVVVTNEASIRIWDRLGFDRIATLPKAFRHAQLGLIDAIIMRKWLGKG